MKVLFVISGNLTGSDVIVNNQAESIMHLNKAVNIEFYKIKGKGVLGYLKNVYPLRQKVKELSPDLIHAHYSLCAYVSALAFPGKPLVVSLMGSDVHLSRLWALVMKLFSPFWKRIIVKSEDMKRRCVVNADDVIPNGVDLSKYPAISKEEAKRELGLDANKKYILFLADPARPEKNYSLAEAAFRKLDDKSCELLTVHNIEHSKTRYYYYAAEVVLMTSLYEGSPNVIKEAMACNCKIVCTDVGDVEELLQDVSGCYVTKFNDEAVANDVRKAIAFMGETGGRQRLINLGLDSASVAQKILRVYEEVLSKKH